jgi:hypothetical protein
MFETANSAILLGFMKGKIAGISNPVIELGNR